MFKLSWFVCIVLCIECTFASPVEAKTGNKTETKSAATPEELDSSRTHNVYYDNIIQKILAPAVAIRPAPVVAPIALHAPISYPSYSAPISYSSYGYGAPLSYPSYGASYVHSAPIVSPVSTIQAPVAAHVSTPLVIPQPIISKPVATHVSTPVLVSQPVVSKPIVSVNQQYAHQPSYAISQQVIHKPYYTEVVEIVRRPVVTEVQEVIHRPVITEVQQAVKHPLYVQHIVKAPSYSSVKQEVHQAPLQLHSEVVHVVAHPSSQVVQLPAQIVKPSPVQIIQTPVYHQQAVSVPAVSVKPALTSGISYGVPSYGSGYSYGSSYGSLPLYGSSYGSSYSSGYLPQSYGFSGLSSGIEHGEYNYLTESYGCRARGDCPKESNEAKDTYSNYNYDPSLGQVFAAPQNQQFSTPQMFTNQFQYPILFQNSQSQKTFTPESTPNDQQTPSQSSQSAETQPSQSGERHSEQNELSPELIRFVSEKINKNPEIMKEIGKYAEEAKIVMKSPDNSDISKSLNQINDFAKNYPNDWTKFYNTEVVAKIKTLQQTDKKEEVGKQTEDKKNV